MSKVEVRKEGPIVFVTINNPPMNVLSSQVTAELLNCFEKLAADNDLRVLVITGAGERAFVAGADIKEFPQVLQGPAGTGKNYSLSVHRMFNALDNFPKPTIAAINGAALGGGCEVTLACDFRIAVEGALFGLPEIKLGLLPGGGGTQRLPRLVGEVKAKELMFLGDHISAKEALKIGLINQVVPQGELMAEVVKFAEKLASRPGVVISLIKEAVQRGTQTSLAEGLQIEADMFDRAFMTEDAQEGVKAFVEKRPPQFTHR
jgi:enoyl-CoA hydratase/carnithine racemase